MSDRIDTRQRLHGMRLFTEFKEAEIDAFLELLDPVHAPAGECVVRQDEPGDCMYILVSGRARVLHRRGSEKFELAVLGPGDFFGELALVDEGPRSADVEAVENCMLLRATQSAVRALAGVYPGAAFKLMVAVGRIMVERMRFGNRKYIDSLLAHGDHR